MGGYQWLKVKDRTYDIDNGLLLIHKKRRLIWLF